MTNSNMSKCVDIFLGRQDAINQGVLVQRVSRKDKEFHFQNWFEERLKEAQIQYDGKSRLRVFSSSVLNCSKNASTTYWSLD